MALETTDYDRENRVLHISKSETREYEETPEAGIARRSTHKIRKTALSKLLDMCLKEDISDISAIRILAGHVDESTLLKSYVFSRRKDEMPLLLEKALTPKNWKHLETFYPELKKAGIL